ncbi:hypothetical protein UA08_04566 [Talaromyces atroroseus]|uniref:Uncharacterized protein n=1 Tax=Talaromyces atroroseus TaxID=1441469 RepID=A0A225AYU0_TALAT|nr:hypothetical protein UA08_04566 [Talaromyces atroroseus]OKL60136.1 hypothetical protein UA08_04566 [Talaromyces atroroseus]
MADSETPSTTAARLSKKAILLSWRTLRSHTFLVIMKAALPPTVVVAMSLSDSILHTTGSTTHIAAAAVIISHCLMPRGKFLKIMIFNILALCMAFLFSCLALYCSVKAGEHNRRIHAPNHANNGYNSDANAVAAIWLIVTIWIANSVRSWRPAELQNPVISFSFFTAVTITHFGNYSTFDEGIDYTLKLFDSILIGFAIASAVSLFILPITSRGFFFQDARDYALLIESVLQEQAAFVGDTVENLAVWFAHGNLRRAQQMQNRPNDETVDETNFPSKLHPSKQKVQTTMAKLDSLFSKLQYDLLYSRSEFAIGKLRIEDLAKIEELLGSVLLPISGISMLPGILEMHIKYERHQQMKMMANDPDEEVLMKQSELRKAVDTLQEHLSETAVLGTTGIQYFLLVMELMTPKQFQKQRKPDAAFAIPKDEESGKFALNPLEPYFVVRFERTMHETFRRRRHFPATLSSLALSEVSKDFENRSLSTENYRDLITSSSNIRLEFFLILYMNHMQDLLLHATHEILKFADSKVADGTMKSYRPILPKHGSIKQLLSILKPEDGKSDVDQPSSSISDIGQGEERTHLPDPERLPPANMWEKGSNVLRLIARGLASEHSVFGFRVTAASFCIAILAFLRRTQDFFFRRRCIWAVTVIIISMNPTSGETFLMLMSRILGTAVSLVLSLIVWYIVDQNFPGVIIFLYFANMIEYYFYVKHPEILEPCVIAILALNVIIASTLEEHKGGSGQSASAGLQQKMPIYIFGPYKLAAVIVACVIILFWTIFPYTSTAKSKLRRMLGHSLFILAQFYSVTHTSTALWMSSGLPDGIRDRESLSHRLVKIIRKIFRKEMVLLDELRNHSRFTVFEPSVGGKFPKRIYDDIIAEIQNALSIPPSPPTDYAEEASASQEQQEEKEEQDTKKERQQEERHEQNEEPWFTQLGKIALQTTDFKSARISSFLCHLSASVTNNQPLPPYLHTPPSFLLARRMQKINKELLHVRHLEDPTFSAFISLEVLRSVLAWCMKDLLRNIKTLVGELNFEYRISQSETHGESSRLVAGRPPGENGESEGDDDDNNTDSNSSG